MGTETIIKMDPESLKWNWILPTPCPNAFKFPILLRGVWGSYQWKLSLLQVLREVKSVSRNSLTEQGKGHLFKCSRLLFRNWTAHLKRKLANYVSPKTALNWATKEGLLPLLKDPSSITNMAGEAKPEIVAGKDEPWASFDGILFLVVYFSVCCLRRSIKKSKTLALKIRMLLSQ